MKAINANRYFFKFLFSSMAFYIGVINSFAQPALPPRSLTVAATQAIHFGTMCITGTSGGTVTVGWNGSRMSSGDIALLSISPTAQPAIFEIKLCQGRNVIITFSSTTILTSSNGGSLILDIGPTEQGGNSAIFATNSDCNFITPLRVGGTLHVPGTTLPGTYTGSFDMTFNQE